MECRDCDSDGGGHTFPVAFKKVGRGHKTDRFALCLPCLKKLRRKNRGMASIVIDFRGEHLREALQNTNGNQASAGRRHR
jgi:hypothetical protein